MISLNCFSLETETISGMQFLHCACEKYIRWFFLSASRHLNRDVEWTSCTWLSLTVQRQNIVNYSGFKAPNSTETALLAYTEMIPAASPAKLSSVLIILNLSADPHSWNLCHSMAMDCFLPRCQLQYIDQDVEDTQSTVYLADILAWMKTRMQQCNMF